MNQKHSDSTEPSCVKSTEVNSSTLSLNLNEPRLLAVLVLTQLVQTVVATSNNGEGMRGKWGWSRELV